MKAVFEASSPDDISFTLTLTMSLKDWVDIKNQLGDYGSCKLKSPITDMVIQAQKTYWPEDND